MKIDMKVLALAALVCGAAAGGGGAAPMTAGSCEADVVEERDDVALLQGGLRNQIMTAPGVCPATGVAVDTFNKQLQALSDPSKFAQGCTENILHIEVMFNDNVMALTKGRQELINYYTAVNVVFDSEGGQAPVPGAQGLMPPNQPPNCIVNPSPEGPSFTWMVYETPGANGGGLEDPHFKWVAGTFIYDLSGRKMVRISVAFYHTGGPADLPVSDRPMQVRSDGPVQAAVDHYWEALTHPCPESVYLLENLYKESSTLRIFNYANNAADVQWCVLQGPKAIMGYYRLLLQSISDSGHPPQSLVSRTEEYQEQPYVPGNAFLAWNLTDTYKFSTTLIFDREGKIYADNGQGWARGFEFSKLCPRA